MVSSFPARMSNGDDIPEKCRDVIRRMKDIVKVCSEQEIYTMLSVCKMDKNKPKGRLLSRVSSRVSDTSGTFADAVRGFVLRKEHATDAPLPPEKPKEVPYPPTSNQLGDSASTSNQNLPLILPNLADDNGGNNNEVHQVQRRSLQQSPPVDPLPSVVTTLQQPSVEKDIDERGLLSEEAFDKYMKKRMTSNERAEVERIGGRWRMDWLNERLSRHMQQPQYDFIIGNDYMFDPPLPYPHSHPYLPPVSPPYESYPPVVEPMPDGWWYITHVSVGPGYVIRSQRVMVPPGRYDLLPPLLGGGGDGCGWGYYNNPRQSHHPIIQPSWVLRPNQPR